MKRLSSTSGVVQDGQLLYLQGGREEVIAIGTTAWQTWLETATSFIFKSERANFTVHKVRSSNGRGGWYWYAYRRRQGRLVNFYLGTSHGVTIQRLHEAAQALQRAEQTGSSMGIADVRIPASSALLTTKLHIPRTSSRHISRPRLLALLDEGALRSLALVSAPAGAGKTTLLAEWAATRTTTSTLPVAWISLEAADNDPLRFMSYLLSALAHLDERIKHTMHAHRIVDQQDLELALTGVLNDLSRLLQQEAVVILDDYHVLTSESVHALLRFLLDHLPARLHLIIGTRVDPPLPLARLRARDQLSEVRAEGLRFVSTEVEALVQVMGLNLSSEATHLLEQRTEGWAVGVQLLTLALRGQADATAFLQTFRGTHRFLLDYVSEEILTRLPLDMQRFLLRSSVLERMMGSLCDAVTGLPGGRERLIELLRANLFINALDDTETWYRYHPLFAETLRAQLQKLEPEVVSDLYRRASEWYEHHQLLEEACDYALFAEDYAQAAQLIAGLLPHMVEQGRFEQLGRWLAKLPAAMIATSPQLYIAMPWLQTLNQQQPEDMEQLLKQLEKHIQEQQDAAVSWVEPRSMLTLFHGLRALGQNELSLAFALGREALNALTTRETALSRLVSRSSQLFLALTYGASSDLATAEQMLLDLSTNRAMGTFSLMSVVALFLLTELYRAQGRLRELRPLYTRLVKTFGANHDLPSIPLLLIRLVLLRQASIFYEHNWLDEAGQLMQQIQEMPQSSLSGEQMPQNPFLISELWMQARIEQAQGLPEAAGAFLDYVSNHPELVEDHQGEHTEGRAMVNVASLASRLSLAAGRIEEAIRWEGAPALQLDIACIVTLMDGWQIFVYLTLVRLLIARGRVQGEEDALTRALTLLDYWYELALRQGFTGWLIEIQLLIALARQLRGEIEPALRILGSALEQAEPEGYIRLFADEGQPMLSLLTKVAAYTNASHKYIQQLQSAIAVHQRALPGPTYIAQAIYDPLTVREREVLTLLANGATNQEIADRLVISLNTVKRHVRHILEKLDVTGRSQAVVRARELHLL